MGQLVAFDVETNRWYNESVNDGDFQSQIFAQGYDDPTYMTFKLEFGGWGYSSLDFAGVTALSRALKYNNKTVDNYGATRNFMYDDLPMGLLDPNFIDAADMKYTSYAFNHQSVYNAYNYLLNRNEDTRAAYIKNFIIGLYEIQHSYPYVFLSISGLDSLSNFSATRGYRVKEGVLTIECQEGLSLKMRTLMELYKKAAWDEVYQRWILPENYRLFKLIIYVFERRTFHSMSAADVTSNENQSFGSKVLNFISSAASYTGSLEAVGSISYIKPSSINNMLPVRAYECYPCEFNIGIKAEDSLNANWSDDTAAKTTITINVKNVRTYMTNKLMVNLSNYMIYDLASNMERAVTKSDNSSSSNIGDIPPLSSIAGTYVNYMYKDMFYKDDMNDVVHQLGGGGNSSSSSALTEQWNNMVDNWKSLFGKGSNSTVSSLNNSTSAMSLVEAESLYDQRESLPWWHYATVTSPGDFKEAGNFFKYLWNLIKSGTQQIKVGPGYAEATSSIFYNLLDFIDYQNSFALDYYSVATQKPANGMETLRNPREIPDNMEMPDAYEYRENPDNTLENDYEYRNNDIDIPDNEYEYKDDKVDIPDNDYNYRTEPEYDTNEDYEYRELDELNLNKLENPRNLPNQELAELDNYRDIIDQTMQTNDNPRDIPNYTLESDTNYRNNPDQSLVNGEDPREIPDYEMDTMDEYRENPEYTFDEPAEARELPEYTFEEDDYTRENPELVFEEQEDVRELPEYEMDSQDDYRDISNEAIESSLSYRNVPDGSFISQDDYRAIETAEMTSTQVYRDIKDNVQTETSTFREKPTGITFETSDGRSYDLYKVDDLITFDNKGRTLPNNVIVEKNEIIDIISKATSTNMSELFKNINDAFNYTERMIKDLLENGDEIYKAYKELGDDRKAIAQALIDFKNDTLQDAIIKRLQLLLKALKQLTELAARSLPDIPVSKATYQNSEDTSKQFTLVPIEAVKRIYDNMLLYGIDEPTLHKMSYQSLIAVNNELLRAITDSEALVEVMQPGTLSKATEDGLKINDGNIENNTKRKTKTGKQLIG